MMFGIGAATRIYLAAGATDMRKSFEGLSGMVREKLRENPLSGHVFVFCNKPRNRLKVLFWDGNGLWVCAKRLERGRFSWPKALEAEGSKSSIAMRAEELAMLIGGIDLSRAKAKDWWRMEVKES